MSIPPNELYKHMLGELQFAAQMRFKIFAAWGAVYAALAGTFVWLQCSGLGQLSVAIPAIALAATFFLWLADARNRPAIRESKKVGKAIEEEMHASLRYFSNLDKGGGSVSLDGVRYSVLVDMFGVLAAVFFLYAIWYLLESGGQLALKTCLS